MNTETSQVATQMEAIEKLHLKWEKQIEDGNGQINRAFFSKTAAEDRKKLFLLDAVLGMEVNAGDMSIEIGGLVLETLNQINQGTVFSYTSDKDNFRNYVLTCNYLLDWLDYDSNETIRSARFDTKFGELEPVMSLMENGYRCNSIPLSSPFVAWFLKFLNHQLVYSYEEREEMMTNLTNFIPTIKTNVELEEVKQHWFLRVAPYEKNKDTIAEIYRQEIIDYIESVNAAVNRAFEQKAEELKNS